MWRWEVRIDFTADARFSVKISELRQVNRVSESKDVKMSRTADVWDYPNWYVLQEEQGALVVEGHS